MFRIRPIDICREDKNSVATLLDTLKNFAGLSGLRFNPAKSFTFVLDTRSNIKAQIVMQTGFHEGELPVTYLGVPLVTARLQVQDCNNWWRSLQAE